MNTGGRPTDYTPEKGEQICQLIASGEYLHKISEAVGVDDSTIIRWARNKEFLLANGGKFCEEYARASDLGWELMAHRILCVADDGTNDYYETQDGEKKVDHEHIQRSKLRVDTMKWILSKRVPKTFGDKLDVTGIPGAQTNVLLPMRERIEKRRKKAE